MTEATDTTTFTSALEQATAEHAGGNEGVNAEVNAEGATTEAATTEPQKYTVKVDGQDVEVTLDEALSGYQRTADYTRKTQELATERQRLSQAEQIAIALEQNPAATIAQLAEHFGVDTPAPQEDLEDLDPLERDVLEMKSFVAQQQEAQVQREIEQEIARIGETYGDTELDSDALLQHAVDRGIGNLDAAYRDLKFNDLYTTAQAQREAQNAAADAAAQEAARAASVVEGGSNRAGGTVTIGGDRPTSVRAAFEAAEQEFMA